MSIQYGGDKITFQDGSTVASGFTGFKNRIINGAMMIDQRNAGASVTPTNGQYTVDRWVAGLTQASKFSVQQSSTAVTGFVNSMLCTSLSAYSVVSGDIFVVEQKVEGNNVADLAWGTSNAVSVTLSFWVRSSLTGTFGGAVRNSDLNRSYPFTYTISAANTWEQKTVTIAGDTSGTWLTTNGTGLRLAFNLGSGSTYSGTAGSWAAANYASATGATSVVGTSGATFYITGVQLEKGSTATSFDYRPYGTELSLCQRYFAKFNDSADGYAVLASGSVQTTTVFYSTLSGFNFRATPTATYANLQIASAGAGKTISAIAVGGATNGTIGISVTSSSMTAGYSGMLQQSNSTSGYLQLSAEL